jgi:hypothetical protein
VAKVRINGEAFSYDRSHKPLAEMMALEKALGITYGQWEAELAEGSARALGGFVWLIWRRDGRDVNFADIESGEVEIDLGAFEVEEDPEPEDPTTRASGTGSSRTGRGGGSSRSPASALGPGR